MKTFEKFNALTFLPSVLLRGVSFVPVMSLALSLAQIAVEVCRSIKQKRKERIPLKGRG
jgi:hypothetical protein